MRNHLVQLHRLVPQGYRLLQLYHLIHPLVGMDHSQQVMQDKCSFQVVLVQIYNNARRVRFAVEETVLHAEEEVVDCPVASPEVVDTATVTPASEVSDLSKKESMHCIGDVIECTEDDRYKLIDVLPNAFKAVFYRVYHPKSGVAFRPGTKVTTSEFVFLCCVENNPAFPSKSHDDVHGHCCSREKDQQHSCDDVKNDAAPRSYVYAYLRQTDVESLLAIPECSKYSYY